jgi:hypothetical protein
VALFVKSAAPGPPRIFSETIALLRNLAPVPNKPRDEVRRGNNLVVSGLATVVKAALVNLALFGIVFGIFCPGYDTNDDLYMQLIASGFYTGHPGEFLVFTNFLIGKALSFFYSHFGTFNWYLFYLVSVHFMASTGIAFLVFRRLQHWSFILVYAVFFVVVESRILVSLQFTTTASLAGVTGLLFLVDGLSRRAAFSWSTTLIGVCFIGLTVAIRELVLPLILILALPFLCERFGVAGWRRLLVSMALCGSVGLGLHALNSWHSRRDPEWTQFTEYNELRGKIHRTKLESYLPLVAPKVGWSANDAAMFSNWYFAEPEVFGSLAQMRSIVAQLQGAAALEKTSLQPRRIQFYLPNLLTGWAGNLVTLALMTALATIVLDGRTRRRYIITVSLSYVVFWLISTYLRETSRLPQRVSLAMPMLLHAICLYWAVCGNSSAANVTASAWHVFTAALRRVGLLRTPIRTSVFAWTAVYLFLLMQLGQGISATSDNNRRIKSASRRIDTPLRTLWHGSKVLLVALPYDSGLEQSLAYSHRSSVPFTILPYGWLTHSPIFNQIVRDFRLHPFSESLLERPDVFFLMEARWIEPLRTFYCEHFGIQVGFDMVLNTDEDPSERALQLHVYKISREP